MYAETKVLNDNYNNIRQTNETRQIKEKKQKEMAVHLWMLVVCYWVKLYFIEKTNIHGNSGSSSEFNKFCFNQILVKQIQCTEPSNLLVLPSSAKILLNTYYVQLL